MATRKPAAAPAAKPATKPGTAVAVKGKASGGALVSIKDQMAAELAALGDRTAPAGGDKIQLKNDKTFNLPDGTKANQLEVVIVDFIATNNFYEGAYDKDNIQPPACFAIGQVISQMVPSDNSPVKQSDACATCPMNQFGSSGNGKACKNMRRLAVLPADADADTPLLVLDVSPTGLKSFDGYVKSVAAKFNMLPIGVVTTITMDPNADYPSLRFGDPQPNENIEAHWSRRTEALERITQEPDVSSYATPQPPKGRGAPARKPATAVRR
jgi:hypothetical protein